MHTKSVTDRNSLSLSIIFDIFQCLVSCFIAFAKILSLSSCQSLKTDNYLLNVITVLAFTNFFLTTRQTTTVFSQLKPLTVGNAFFSDVNHASLVVKLELNVVRCLWRLQFNAAPTHPFNLADSFIVLGWTNHKINLSWLAEEGDEPHFFVVALGDKAFVD